MYVYVCVVCFLVSIHANVVDKKYIVFIVFLYMLFREWANSSASSSELARVQVHIFKIIISCSRFVDCFFLFLNFLCGPARCRQ